MMKFGSFATNFVTPVLTLEERIERLGKEHERLEDKRDLHHRYNQRVSAAVFFAFVSYYGMALEGVFAPALRGSLIIVELVSFFIGTASAILVRPLKKRAVKYKLSGEEWLFLESYHVLSDLDSCLKEEEPVPHYRGLAVKDLLKLIEDIESDWKIGRFRLVEMSMAPLSKLKNGVREGLLPAVARGPRDKLDAARVWMADFSDYLLKKAPTLQDIMALNADLVPLAGETLDRPWYVRFLHFTKSHLKWKTIVFGSLSLFSGLVLYTVLILSGFSKESAIQPSVEMSLGFTSIYVGWLGVQAYLKMKSSD
jgi:hypothetical protein